MIEINQGKIQCESCIHSVVCGHKQEWKNYCEEHIKLRKKSILFDVDPNCRYYISDLKAEVTVTNDTYGVKTDNAKQKQKGLNKKVFTYYADELPKAQDKLEFSKGDSHTDEIITKYLKDIFGCGLTFDE